MIQPYYFKFKDATKIPNVSNDKLYLALNDDNSNLEYVNDVNEFAFASKSKVTFDSLWTSDVMNSIPFDGDQLQTMIVQVNALSMKLDALDNAFKAQQDEPIKLSSGIKAEITKQVKSALNG